MQIKSWKIGIAAVLAAACTLTACNRYVDKADRQIETTLTRVEGHLQQAKVPDLPAPIDTVRVQNDIWLGESSTKIMEGDALPAWAEKENGVTLVISEQATLPELAQTLTDLTGIPVRIDDLKSEQNVPTDSVPVNYSGKLSGLLNYLSNRYGVWWKYQGGVITFFTKETRVFTIYALPTETTMSASLSGASMGKEAGGGANSSLSTSANLALWDTIEKGLQQTVGKEAELSFSRAAGTVTVTASPFVIRKAGHYIANWNEKLSRQCAITIKVLQVTLNNADNYGLDLGAVFQNTDVLGKFTSPWTAAANSSGAGELGRLSLTLLSPNSKWKDSTAIIQAFSTQGKTALVTSSSVTTLNNKVAPVQITTSQNYVRKSTVTVNNNSNSSDTSTDMETDTLNYGFTMEILPRILDHGRLIIMFSMTLTDLISLDTFSSDGSTGNAGGGSNTNGNTNDNNGNNTGTGGDVTVVQLPKMQTRGFMQEIAMTSGSTLVLTGFENTQDVTETAGIGKARMGVLGGKAYATKLRTVMVILLTPEVLQSPLAPEARMRNF
ncbi:MAG: hypothetical protein PHX68_00710 [Alphaproteobacteria bacterium]|nr:hypothetical protein [Alphaproteobacteria bacterium]